MWLPYMCVIFLFIFHISQIWEFVYIPIMLYFACNDWYLVWFSSAYTSQKEKCLRRKKRMEARIVILIRKALLQSSMSKLKVISNVLINCIFNACMLNPIRIFYSWISSIHVCSTCLILQQLDWCRFDVRDNSW